MAQAFNAIVRLVGPSLHVVVDVDVAVVTDVVVDAHAFGSTSSGHQTGLVLSDLHKHSASRDTSQTYTLNSHSLKKSTRRNTTLKQCKLTPTRMNLCPQITNAQITFYR